MKNSKNTKKMKWKQSFATFKGGKTKYRIYKKKPSKFFPI